MMESTSRWEDLCHHEQLTPSLLFYRSLLFLPLHFFSISDFGFQLISANINIIQVTSNLIVQNRYMLVLTDQYLKP